jgi:hypothetical protein
LLHCGVHPIPAIIHAASHLKCRGQLARSENNLTYLDIDDAYIHKLFPLLQNNQIKIPNYFGVKSSGAHISIIYPEENIQINGDDLNREHEFKVNGAFAAEIGLKKYYVLMVDAPSLLLLRRKYGLSDMLPFKGYSIDFHITIGVQPL